MKYIITIVIALLAVSDVSSQDVWDLNRCVRHAQATNVTLQQAEVNYKSARLDEQGAKNGRLPSVSANINLGDQFGRTIDPTTNTFVNAQTIFSQASLSANVNLFAGGQVLNSITQTRLGSYAAKAEMEQSANDLSLSVASAYLNALLSEEQLKTAEKRIEQSREQLKNTKKIIAVGNLPAADSLNLLAQIARDRGVLIQAENQKALAYLNLKQLLQLDPEYNMSLEVPALDAIEASTDPDKILLKATYLQAAENQPSMRAAKLRIDAANTGIQVAKAGAYPTLSAFAQINSNYSSQFKTLDEFKGVEYSDAYPARIDGQLVMIQDAIPLVDLKTIGYFDQMDQTFGQAIGLNLSIPIYQNGRTKLNVERARLGVISAEVQRNATEQQLKTDIQTAIANARAAKRQLEAARNSYKAAEVAYDNTQKRYKYGATTLLEQTIAQNNVFIAENDLTTARYDYIFKLKIIDFYLGREIKLK